MKTQALPFLLLFALLSFSSCKKKDANPKEELPAVTMEGKNTFGAMVNGKVWLPKGRPSTFQSNFNVIYDPAYKGGTLNIAAYRETKESPAEYDYFVIAMAQVNKAGVYTFDNAEISGVRFYNEYCDYDKSPDVTRSGTLEVTKLDLENGIIAGKFSFTLSKNGCEVIHVTEGRFDGKL
ncbi:hypothetical protein [uncultured Pontibacter sp.]|uniref:hypothetical protein n=1 Tax=uncultured Pontibacter sp. TaxID=453356 RepID=UPI00262AFD89|nr:hypothetical protein [uncultured Pontibacter sp.]